MSGHFSLRKTNASDLLRVKLTARDWHLISTSDTCAQCATFIFAWKIRHSTHWGFLREKHPILRPNRSISRLTGKPHRYRCYSRKEPSDALTASQATQIWYAYFKEYFPRKTWDLPKRKNVRIFSEQILSRGLCEYASFKLSARYSMIARFQWNSQAMSAL